MTCWRQLDMNVASMILWHWGTANYDGLLHQESACYFMENDYVECGQSLRDHTMLRNHLFDP